MSICTIYNSVRITIKQTDKNMYYTSVVTTVHVSVKPEVRYFIKKEGRACHMLPKPRFMIAGM